jgi:uncharacterized protein (TIRG00374 family)
VVATKYQTWLKRLLALVLLLVLVYFFLPLLDEISEVGDLFRTARWEWLPVALLAQLISYIFLTWLNQLSLAPFAGKIGFWRLAAVLTSMAFIQVAVPSACVSGVAMRIRMLGKSGYRNEEALFSLAVESIAEMVVLVMVGLVGVAYLFQSDQFQVWEIVLLVSGGFLTVALLWVGWVALRDEQLSQRILRKFIGQWNRLVGRSRQQELNVLSGRLVEFRSNLQRYRDIPLWKFILATFGKVILDIATLGIGFSLFGFAIHWGTLLTGYGLILIFSVIAILPGGLGMTDAYVPVIFSWLNVPGEVALAAGLIYRLIAYWLLRFVCFLSWVILERIKT